MSHIVRQADIEAVLQNSKTVYIKIELLNRQFITVEQLEGELQHDDYSIDAESDIRRSYKATFVVKDSTYQVGHDSKIWLDKYIKVSVGLWHIRMQEVLWYNMGIYTPSLADYSFDASTKTLTFSCLDLMAELTGIRNGQLSGMGVTINAFIDDKNKTPNKIRSAMIKIIEEFSNINKIRIDEIGAIAQGENSNTSDSAKAFDGAVPYDLEFQTGTYIFDIIKTLRDLYPGFETFIDNDRFICQQIPTAISDPVAIDANTMEKLVISENTSIDFSQIKNVIEIWGKVPSSGYYTENVKYNSNSGYSIIAKYYTVTELKSGENYSFMAPDDNIGGESFKIDSFNSYPILTENNEPIKAGRIVKGHIYVLKYRSYGSDSYFYFLGEDQPAAIAKLRSKMPTKEDIIRDKEKEPIRNIEYIVNPNSPFCSDFENIGEIRQVLSGGEYDNIWSDDLAMQRAKYETWLRTDLIDTVSLSMIAVPWLDVNTKIEYKNQALGKVETYLVKNISGSTTSGIMNLTAQKFQPLYPWLG